MLRSFIIRRCALLCISILMCLKISAQSFNTLLFDVDQSEFFGAGNLRTLHRSLYALQDKHIPDTLVRETKPGAKILGMGYRAVKVFFLDFQEDFLIALAQHEIFGHGARFREFDYDENSFHLSLFYPFGEGSGFARSGNLKEGKTVTAHENITKVLAGNEANLVLAGSIWDYALLDDALHYREALLYLVSQNNQLEYIWLTKLKRNGTTFGSGDIDDYLFELNNLYFTPGKKIVTVDDLATQSLISLLNPAQVYSAFALIYTYGIKGKKVLRGLPMVKVGSVKYLPSFNYSLTPFGAQYHFINYAKYKQSLFVADFSLGDNNYSNFYGASFKALNIVSSKILNANVHLSMWQQPELELEKTSSVLFADSKTGWIIKTDLHLHPFGYANKLGLFFEAGYKTKGYTIGEMLDKGEIIRFGLSFNPANQYTAQ